MKTYQREKKPLVFVSYNKGDKDVAREIALFLTSENINVWFDEWELFSSKWKYENEGTEQPVGTQWYFEVPDIEAYVRVYSDGGLITQSPFIFYLDKNQKEYKLKVYNGKTHISEFNNLLENASRIDEEMVKHLLKHIGIDFSTFLNSLKKIVTIKTFKTKDGNLIPLESLHQPIQERIRGKGYLSIITILNEFKLDKSLQTEIIDYISNEFSGRFNVEKTYFFSEQLILRVEEEIKLFSRINFDIIAYKLDLPKTVVEMIIQQILFIKGFMNKAGEFITIKGIKDEINRILEFKGEILLEELYEVLEISEDEKHQEVVRDLIFSEKKFIQGANQQIFFTQKRAMNIVLHLLKKPETRTKELIEWAELTGSTNLLKENLKLILESLISNQLIPGVLDKKGFRP